MPQASAEPPVPHRLSNRFIAGVMLGIMAILAVVALLLVWDPVSIRRHDLKIPKPQSLSVPLVLRIGLGVYILVLVYTGVRAVRRRLAKGTDEGTGPVSRTAWRFTFPALVLAGLVLIVVVVQTTPKTRPALERERPVKPVRTVAATEWAALGYLPADTTVALAVDIAELARQIPEKQREEKLTSSAELLGINRLMKATGLAVADIEQFVLGVSGGPGGPKYTLVAETGKPYDQAALRRKLSPVQIVEHEGRPVYFVRRQKVPKALVWCAGPRTLVAVSQRGNAPPLDLAALPRRARTGTARLPKILHDILDHRPLTPDTPVWAAGRIKGAGVVEALRAELPFFHPAMVLGKRVQVFRADFQLDPGATLTADFQGVDHRAAKDLENALKPVENTFRNLGLKGVRVSVHRDPKDNWVVLQAKAPRDVVLGLLGGEDKAK
jgi:hypothetical protein